jgi:hypothetical protein
MHPVAAQMEERDGRGEVTGKKEQQDQTESNAFCTNNASPAQSEASDSVTVDGCKKEQRTPPTWSERGQGVAGFH